MDLMQSLVKLGTTNPELRPHIRPVLQHLGSKSKSLTSNQYDGLLDYLVNAFEHAEGMKEEVSYLVKEIKISREFANRLVQLASKKPYHNDEYASAIIDEVSRDLGYDNR